jgi:hypothetical protein
MTESVAAQIGRLVRARRHDATEPDKSRPRGDKNPEHRIDSHVVLHGRPLRYLNACSAKTLPAPMSQRSNVAGVLAA